MFWNCFEFPFWHPRAFWRYIWTVSGTWEGANRNPKQIENKVYPVYLVFELFWVPMVPRAPLEVYLDCQWPLAGGKQGPETNQKQGIPDMP